MLGEISEESTLPIHKKVKIYKKLTLLAHPPLYVYE